MGRKKKTGRRKNYEDEVLTFGWALSTESERRRSTYRTSGHSIREAKKIIEKAAKEGIIEPKYTNVHPVTINRAVHDCCSGSKAYLSVVDRTVRDQTTGNVVFPKVELKKAELADPVEIWRFSKEAEEGEVVSWGERGRRKPEEFHE